MTGYQIFEDPKVLNTLETFLTKIVIYICIHLNFNIFTLLFDILNPVIQVQKAIVFASTAHIGQFRRTGDPYVTHCIHTGKILAALVPSTGERVWLRRPSVSIGFS